MRLIDAWLSSARAPAGAMTHWPDDASNPRRDLGSKSRDPVANFYQDEQIL
jgi:hypothetical protein